MRSGVLGAGRAEAVPLSSSIHVLLRPRHAVMRPKEDGIHYEDLCSLNGSFVNEERLEGEVVLKAGDILQVGQSVVRITTK